MPYRTFIILLVLLFIYCLFISVRCIQLQQNDNRWINPNALRCLSCIRAFIFFWNYLRLANILVLNLRTKILKLPTYCDSLVNIFSAWTKDALPEVSILHSGFSLNKLYSENKQAYFSYHISFVRKQTRILWHIWYIWLISIIPEWWEYFRKML